MLLTQILVTLCYKCITFCDFNFRFYITFWYIYSMKELIYIRKELDLSQQDVADELKITRSAYAKMEKRGCNLAVKKKIIFYFILECNNRASSRKELGISQRRLAKLLGIKRSCLCMREKNGTYIKGLRNVLEKERERRMQLKDGLFKMLNKC